MARPNQNKKGRTKPMPQVDWNGTFIEYGQLANECNRHLDRNKHAEDCPGDCELVELYGSEVDLHNEVVRWNKHDWAIQGIPSSFIGLGPPGIGINLLQLDFVQTALIKFLVEMDIINEDELNDKLRVVKTERLTKIREAQEKIMAREEAAAKLVVPDKRIIGPNGEVLH